MATTLRNRSNQPVTIILDHPAFQNSDSGWRRSSAKFASTSAEGIRAETEVRRSYHGTLRIPAGGEAKDLHSAILKCSQVPALLARRVLVAINQENA